MTPAEAYALSVSLTEGGFSHTVWVRCHQGLAPPVSAYVEVPLHELRGDIAGRAALLAAVAARHGLALDTGLLEPTHIGFVDAEQQAQQQRRRALGAA